MQAAAWILPSNLNSHANLLASLCKRHEGSMELHIKNYNGRRFFEEKHFAFCCLGTRKGSVLDQDSFVEFLKSNKMINLLLDYNNFLEHELDQEENEASVERRSTLQPRSSTAYTECSKSPSPSVISTITAPREKSAFPPKNPSEPESHKKNEMFEVQSSNDSDLPKIVVRSSHADAAVKLNPKSKHNDMKVVFKRSPPC
jgi:hypothetical protein